MSVLSAALFGAWLAFNAALFVALWLRRRNPKLRAKLFSWVVRGRLAPSSSLPLSSKICR
jgi:hypothetical protein